MGEAGVETPVSAANGDQVHLGVDDGSANGSGNFLGSLDAKADVAVGVADGNVALEASSLASSGLLLDRHDLHHLVL